VVAAEQGCPFCPGGAWLTGLELENRLCLLLVAGEPVLRGSGVIIPRAHRPTPFDLTPAEWAATRELLLQARDLLTARLGPDGFTLGWNCGPSAGQHVAHAHLHVIPRFADEPYAGRGIRYWLKSDANRRPGAVPGG